MQSKAVLGEPIYTFTSHAGMGGSPKALRKAGLLKALDGADDLGDVKLPPLKADSSEGNVKNLPTFVKASEAIYRKVKTIDADRVIFLGGECSGVVGNIAGLTEAFEGKPGMLWMDAHGDFNTPETSPSGYIGGMCLAMACGRGPELGPDIDQMRPLVTEERLVHVGSRALDPPEIEAFNSSPAKLFTAQHVRSKGAKDVAEDAARHLANRADWLVCHLDVDVMDPSIVPAVSYPTPGGLTVDEVVTIILKLNTTGKLRVVELAAYNAAKDSDGSSARTIVDLVRRAHL